MKLLFHKHLYSWDPVKWIIQLFIYGKFKRRTLEETQSWHDVLGIFLRDVPEEVPVKLYNELQELRRDINHYRLDLMRNKL